MEGFYESTNPRGAKLNQQFFIGGGLSDTSYLENVDLTLLKYLRSESLASPAGGDGFRTPSFEFLNHSPKIDGRCLGSKSSTCGGSGGLSSRGGSFLSPLSSVENFETPLFKTPVKVEVLEEDVLVMDGILVGSRPGAKARSSTSSESSGSSSSGHNSFYRKEICRSWEDSSQCRYGYKCQFAHGKEEVRPTCFLNSNKSEAPKRKSHSNSGQSIHWGRGDFLHHQVMKVESTTEREVTIKAPVKTQLISPKETEKSSKSSSTESTSTDWCPVDDGIDVVLPSSLSTETTHSREDVNSNIDNVLYGPTRGKRLPVFAEISSEQRPLY